MYKTTFKGFISLSAVAFIASLLLSPLNADAATNTALGSIAGISADLSNSNDVILNSQTLALVKKAFLTDGTALLGDGTETLPRGTQVRFLIYVNNATLFDIADVRVSDQLTGFAFVSGGLFHEANVLNACGAAICTPGEEAALLTTITGNALNQRGEGTADADSMSYDTPTTTVSAGQTANAAITANADSAWGMVFEATIQ